MIIAKRTDVANIVFAGLMVTGAILILALTWPDVSEVLAAAYTAAAFGISLVVWLFVGGSPGKTGRDQWSIIICTAGWGLSWGVVAEIILGDWHATDVVLLEAGVMLGALFGLIWSHLRQTSVRPVLLGLLVGAGLSSVTLLLLLLAGGVDRRILLSAVEATLAITGGGGLTGMALAVLLTHLSLSGPKRSPLS